MTPDQYSEVVRKIWQLAKDRSWGIHENRWCLCKGNNYILIGRFGIEKYKDAYYEEILIQCRHRKKSKEDLSYDVKWLLEKLDLLLLECIKINIPAAKNVLFKFYNIDNVINSEGTPYMMEYPPEK